MNINMVESSPRRKLAVILATDVVGYSTKMEENEDQTLNNLMVYRSIIDGLVEEYHGRIFNTAGDSSPCWISKVPSKQSYVPQSFKTL